MAGAEAHPVDGGPALPAGLQRVTRWLAALGSLWIVALMLLINADVIGRGVFDAPVRGVPELVGVSIVGIVFLQLADTLRCGRLTRADMFLGPLRRRRPALGAAVQAVFHGLGASLMGLILWAAGPQWVDAVRIGEYVGALGDFMAPVWPVRLAMLAGLGVGALTFAWLAMVEARLAWQLRRGGA